MSRRTLQAFWARTARALLLGAVAIALLGGAKPTATAGAGEPSVSKEELDALLAPVALYPDGLLSQVLMASTYPLEIVEAERFLKQNPELRGEALDEAVAKKNWDPSVQSLTAYPKVVIMMSEKLEWTERLGNAFLEDQGRVMDTVQALRKRAEAAGNLKSNEQQSVVHDREAIVIEPSQTEVVYVVDYDPAVVYGAYWAAAAGYYYGRYYGAYSYSVSASYTSYHVSGNHWGWSRANWHDRNLSVDGRGNRFWNGAGRSEAQGAWQHDALHRRGAEYPTSALRDQFRGPQNAAVRPGDGRPGAGPQGAGPGAPSSLAGRAPPNGPAGALGGGRPGPAGPDLAHGPFGSGMPGLPSMPPGGPPGFGMGPPGGLGGPPPGPPGPPH
jgi:hypothetical protein